MRNRLQLLQAGRAFAAILVVMFHISVSIFEDPRFWGQQVFGGFFNFGHAGVMFFFVLSGYIILEAHAGDIGKPSALPSYTIRRIVRI